MTTTAIASTEPNYQQRGAVNRSKPLRVTGKLKQAVDLMVWECRSDSEAAVTAGMHVIALRLALRRPHVRAYFREQTDVLRQREGPANIHALIEVRSQKSNQMARVAAVKALEHIEEQAESRPARQLMPGFSIVIVNQSGAVGAQDGRIEAKPLIEHGSVRVEERPLPREGSADD